MKRVGDLRPSSKANVNFMSKAESVCYFTAPFGNKFVCEFLKNYS
jgi:hypothetical protein